jgi:hypothetical protein
MISLLKFLFPRLIADVERRSKLTGSAERSWKLGSFEITIGHDNNGEKK